MIPLKQKAPQQFEVGSAEDSCSDTVEDHYRCQYYKVLDTVLSDCFDQPGYHMYRIDATNGKEFDKFFESATSFYKDFNRTLVSTATEPPYVLYIWITLEECTAFLRDLSFPQKTLFSEVWRIECLIERITFQLVS